MRVTVLAPARSQLGAMSMASRACTGMTQRAPRLRSVDLTGEMDRYVHVQHAQVRDGGPNLNPVWDECFLAVRVAGSDNERGAAVALTVMDSNAGAIVDCSDEFL